MHRNVVTIQALPDKNCRAAEKDLLIQAFQQETFTLKIN